MNKNGTNSFVFFVALIFCATFEEVVSQLVENSAISSSGCFPLVQHKILENINSSPRCNVTFLHKNPASCVVRGKNVFQIIGDFSVLSLNCTAPYLLDLDFDGFRPTEAVNVFLWRDVVEITDEANANETHGIKVKSFGLNATITSIQTLFQQYKTYMRMNEEQERPLPFFQRNLTSPIVYPRTGRVRIRGMKLNHTRKFQDFYFFFQETSLENEISFMENEHTLKPLYKSEISNGSVILIPCRTSHFTTNVTLRFKNASVATRNNWSAVAQDSVTFDPTIGFKVLAQDVGLESADALTTIQFQCSAISTSGKIAIWEAHPKAEEVPVNKGVPIYGVHLLKQPVAEAVESLSISFDQLVHENGLHFARISCSFDEAQPNASLFVVGYRQQSFAELNFAREFALPVFANRSYFVLKGNRPTDRSIAFELVVDPARGTGVAFCETRDSFKFTEFTTSPFTDSKYPFPAGSFQPPLPFQAVPGALFIRVEQVGPRTGSAIYTHQTAEFVCDIQNTYTINRKPILWFSQNSQGVRKMIFKDDFVSDDPLRVYDSSRLKLQLTSDVVQILCMGALWQTDTWRHSAVQVKVTDGAAPTFVGSNEKFSFPRDSLNRTISCVTDGDPIPQVWWEKDGVKLGKTGWTQLKTASYEIRKVEESSLGKYTCVAQNPYGTIERHFLVEFSASDSVFLLLVVGLPTLIFFILLLLAIVLYSRSRLRKEILTAEELKDFREGVDASKLNEEKDSPAMTLPYNNEFEIPPGEFSIRRDALLGCGEFGMVMEATVKDRAVAAKTVKPDCDKIHFKSLIMELKILMYLGKHPHLIEFVGAYTKNIHRGAIYVFVELCEGGNLLAFLQKHRHNFSKNRTESTGNYQNDDALTLPMLHEWAFQIAEGMNYLGSKRVIHGDLAARNVLLTADKTAKITDFGLSRQLLSYSTYMKQSEEPLPFRWMSLESLESLEFSCESDVWSYGVLLWEIYSLGRVPFSNLSWDIEFVESLRNGFRMDCPHTISHQLFASLIYPCWENDPKTRPRFDHISAILDKLREKQSTETPA